MTRIKITKELILNLHSLNLSKKQVATHLEIPISILNQGLEQLQLKKLKFSKVDLEETPVLPLPEVINTHTFTMYEEGLIKDPSFNQKQLESILDEAATYGINLDIPNDVDVRLASNTSHGVYTEETVANVVETVDPVIDVEEVEWEEVELEEFLEEQHDRERQDHENWLAETLRQENEERENYNAFVTEEMARQDERDREYNDERYYNDEIPF